MQVHPFIRVSFAFLRRIFTKPVVFILMFICSLMYDLLGLLFQVFILQWTIVPIICGSLAFTANLIIFISFWCIIKRNFLVFAMIKLFELVIFSTLWAANIIRWFNNDRDPEWVNGIDRSWKDYDALANSYKILFAWLLMNAFLVFVIFFIHYLPRMKTLPCFTDAYNFLYSTIESNDTIDNELDIIEENDHKNEIEIENEEKENIENNDINIESEEINIESDEIIIE